MHVFSPNRKLYCLIVFLSALLCGAGCGERQDQAISGTSVVVLVDFSKSFIPLSQEDKSALEAVSEATVDLAKHVWRPPIGILWSRIQTASLLSSPLCGPFQFQQHLIKRDDDSHSITDTLQECTNKTIKIPIKSPQQTQYTDISGAIALATEQGKSVNGDKYLIIISDLLEDLPLGQQPVSLGLNGEHVLLLHRMGSDHTKGGDLYDHLARISKWMKRLRSAGASSVVALPLADATTPRIIRALEGGKAGTNLVIFQSLPDPPGRSDVFTTVANTVASAAHEMESPVTVTWADMRDATSGPWQMPSLQLTEQLIKRGNSSIQSPKDLQLFLKEYSEKMRRVPGVQMPDIGSTLSFYASAGAVDSQNIFLILSSFPESPKRLSDITQDLNGIHIVMLAIPDEEDAKDESGYFLRLSKWEHWFNEQHSTVCRLSLNGIVSSSLMNCIHGH